jgi:hypothetical protein
MQAFAVDHLHAFRRSDLRRDVGHQPVADQHGRRSDIGAGDWMHRYVLDQEGLARKRRSHRESNPDPHSALREGGCLRVFPAASGFRVALDLLGQIFLAKLPVNEYLLHLSVVGADARQTWRGRHPAHRSIPAPRFDPVASPIDRHHRQRFVFGQPAVLYRLRRLVVQGVE